MLQDIAPYKFHNEFEIKEPREEDFVLIFKNSQVLLANASDGPEIPSVAHIQNMIPSMCEQLTYLFCIDQYNFFLAENTETLPEGEISGFSYNKLQIFRQMHPKWMGFAGVTGSQLHRWYTNHQFCGYCGKPMHQSSMERAMVCEECGLIEYPKISPAVIVGITNGDKIIMTRYANRPFKKYALIAGFMEIGETLEETVDREVMEEVGVKVKNIRYYGNQPWAFSDTLLVGFFAELDGDDKITMDEDELAEAGWFTREEIPIDEENDISLTYMMMEAFREKREYEVSHE